MSRETKGVLRYLGLTSGDVTLLEALEVFRGGELAHVRGQGSDIEPDVRGELDPHPAIRAFEPHRGRTGQVVVPRRLGDVALMAIDVDPGRSRHVRGVFGPLLGISSAARDLPLRFRVLRSRWELDPARDSAGDDLLAQDVGVAGVLSQLAQDL